MPALFRDRMHDLDTYIREVISSATEDLLIITPYLSPAGIESLKKSLFIAADKGVWIRLLTSNLDSDMAMNSDAVNDLLSDPGASSLRSRFRILSTPPDNATLFHSKAIIADRARGYLGSANISQSAFENNFELGVSLTPFQARTIEDIISYMETTGTIVDFSTRFISQD